MNQDVDYKKLIDEGRRFLSLEWEYSKLTAVEKIAILLSAIASVTVVGILCVFAIIYLLSSFVEALITWTGSTWIAHLIVVCLLGLLILLVLAFKNTLIVNPITRFVTKLFLTPPDNDRK